MSERSAKMDLANELRGYGSERIRKWGQRLAIEARSEMFAASMHEDQGFLSEPWEVVPKLCVMTHWEGACWAAGINRDKAPNRDWAKDYAKHVKGEHGKRLRLALDVATYIEAVGWWTGAAIPAGELLKRADALGLPGVASSEVLPDPAPVEPTSSAPEAIPVLAAGTGTKESRQARRYQVCIDAKLKMPTDTYARMPRGIGKLAEREGITRQAFTEDVRAHIGRLHGR